MVNGNSAKRIMVRLAALCMIAGSGWADSSVEYDFNGFNDGPVDRQGGWSVYDKVKDSSAFSVVNELGTSEEDGDRALVVRSSGTPIRCVTGEPVRWLPGQTLKVAYDFKLATGSATMIENRPVLVFYMGNSVLNEKARWEVALEATTNGDWLVSASLPDAASQRIYAENLLIRSRNATSISKWHRFVLVVKKLSQPDSFESSVQILDAAGTVVAELKCMDTTKDPVTKAMWNLTRLHVGFSSPKNLYGLVCIDNLEITSSE